MEKKLVTGQNGLRICRHLLAIGAGNFFNIIKQGVAKLVFQIRKSQIGEIVGLSIWEY